MNIRHFFKENKKSFSDWPSKLPVKAHSSTQNSPSMGRAQRQRPAVRAGDGSDSDSGEITLEPRWFVA